MLLYLGTCFKKKGSQLIHDSGAQIEQRTVNLALDPTLRERSHVQGGRVVRCLHLERVLKEEGVD